MARQKIWREGGAGGEEENAGGEELDSQIARAKREDVEERQDAGVGRSLDSEGLGRVRAGLFETERVLRDLERGLRLMWERPRGSTSPRAAPQAAGAAHLQPARYLHIVLR
eukprot:2268958-Rhodomonas_salina.2